MVEVEFSLSEPDSGEGDGKSSPRAGVVDDVSEMVRGSKRASRLGRGREAMLVDVLVERFVPVGIRVLPILGLPVTCTRRARAIRAPIQTPRIFA